MAAARTLVVVVALVQLTCIDADASSLRASPSSTGVDTKLADTVRALDTNGNGKVDQSELTGFAKTQGLSSEEVLTDFKELDLNNDGALDSSEIGPLFGVADASGTPAEVAKPTAWMQPGAPVEHMPDRCTAYLDTNAGVTYGGGGLDGQAGSGVGEGEPVAAAFVSASATKAGGAGGGNWTSCPF